MRQGFLAALLLGWAALAPAQALRAWSGGTAPPLEPQDLDGGAHRLAEYRGKTVRGTSWATWCAPCREEMPNIEHLRRALEVQPFTALAVNGGARAGPA